MLLASCLAGPFVEAVEKLLPESQCGVKKRHSNTNMIFMVREPVEKAIYRT